MYTLIYELYRKEGLSQGEFVDYWLNTHRPIAMKMPNLRGYEIWPVEESAEVLGDDVAGFVLLRFDSREDFEETHASEEFAATAADADNFCRHYTRYAVQIHEVI
jgi:uncharacterized protein (TIGR02118 family)